LDHIEHLNKEKTLLQATNDQLASDFEGLEQDNLHLNALIE
jgi:hypothetical protein